MAKSKFQPFLDNLDKILDKLDQEVVQDLGDQAATDIKTRTRAGYGVDSNGGSKQRLEVLSESYKTQRRRMELSGDTSVSKSNLTQSGSMLDSLKFKRVSKFKGEVAPEGNGPDGMPNELKAAYVSEQGRPFLFLSKPEIKRLQETLKKRLVTIVKDLF